VASSTMARASWLMSVGLIFLLDRLGIVILCYILSLIAPWKMVAATRLLESKEDPMGTLLTITDRLATPRLLKPDLTNLIHQKAVAICHPIMVNTAISHFLSSVLLESLSFRQEEWRLRGIDPSEAGIIQIVTWVRPSLVTLLSKATRCAQDKGRNDILLMDVLSAMHKNWCKIWPFCN